MAGAAHKRTSMLAELMSLLECCMFSLVLRPTCVRLMECSRLALCAACVQAPQTQESRYALVRERKQGHQAP